MVRWWCDRPSIRICGVAGGEDAQLHGRTLCGEQNAHGAAGRIQPRHAERAAEATGIAYDERAKGTLQLFRTQKQLDGTAGDVEVLKTYGVPYEVLDPDGCSAAEPALAGVREKFVGGLRLPGDETGDCKMFTDRLAELCVARGVTFEYDTPIRRVVRNRNRITTSTPTGLEGSRYLCLAMGSYSARFMRMLKR
jgi:D-amino-acid dehydrogenase